MDPSSPVNPRTIADHDAMALRAVQRQSAEDTSIVARASGLRTAVVTDVDNRGNFQIDAFSDGSGAGTWFSSLNFTQPITGESVVWAYVEGVATVLGPVATDLRPWRVPTAGMPDTFFFDDFDIGAASSGIISQGNWQVATSGGSSLQWAGNKDHPGMLQISTGTGTGTYTYVVTGMTNPIESLDEVELYIDPSAVPFTGYEVDIALTDGSALANGLFARYNSVQTGFDQGWGIFRQNASVSTVIGYTDPIVPVVSGHFYRINFKRLATGSWMATITDMTASPAIEGAVLITNVPSIDAYIYARVLNQGVSAVVKYLSIDYVWWSRRRLQRTTAL